MLWMRIWVHHYAVIILQVGVSFRENGVWPSLNDNAVSLLRLQTPIDCIPHPYWMYTKSFSTLRCCGCAYGCIIIAVLHVQVGGILGKMGYGRACTMLRCHGRGFKPPLTASHIHIGCIQSFSTLRCCGWAYGCISIAVLHVQVGGILGIMGYGRACMMLRCHGRGFKPPLTASPIHIGCIQRGLAP